MTLPAARSIKQFAELVLQELTNSIRNLRGTGQPRVEINAPPKRPA